SGQGMPLSAQVRKAATKSACDIGGWLRPVPGAQAHSTSGSMDMCSMTWAPVRRLPLRAGSFIWRQISPAFKPCQLMLAGARCQCLAPGTWPLAELPYWWQATQFCPAAPCPSLPRTTPWVWRVLKSVWRGASAWWQLTQRGCITTRAIGSNRGAGGFAASGCAFAVASASVLSQSAAAFWMTVMVRFR
ncbi:MAG: hypothetical protein ACK5QX_10655, partial [bacterium]